MKILLVLCCAQLYTNLPINSQTKKTMNVGLEYKITNILKPLIAMLQLFLGIKRKLFT